MPALFQVPGYPSLCDAVADLTTQGMSINGIAALTGANRRSICDWRKKLKEHPELLDRKCTGCDLGGQPRPECKAAVRAGRKTLCER